eukprot:2523805-Lingulodinium_polyedra.AAC.1
MATSSVLLQWADTVWAFKNPTNTTTTPVNILCDAPMGRIPQRAGAVLCWTFRNPRNTMQPMGTSSAMLQWAGAV